MIVVHATLLRLDIAKLTLAQRADAALLFDKRSPNSLEIKWLDADAAIDPLPFSFRKFDIQH
jgi:hypothetical protein